MRRVFCPKILDMQITDKIRFRAILRPESWGGVGFHTRYLENLVEEVFEFFLCVIRQR